MKPFYISSLLLLLLLSGAVSAQNDQLNGPTTASSAELALITINPSFVGEFVNPQWTITRGTVQSSSVSTDKSKATVTVVWNSAGTGTVSLSDGGVSYGSKNVTVACAGVPTFTSQTACNGQVSNITGLGGYKRHQLKVV